MTNFFYFLVLFGSALAEPLRESIADHQWYIYFYTGNKLWAGTDSKVYVELLGDEGNSPIINIQSNRFQLEANSVDVYPLKNLGGRKIGKLTSIIVGKQYSFSFFNDWFLKKVEVIDPMQNRFIFECNCWLRKSSYKKMINLTRIEHYADSVYNEDDLEHKLYSIRGTTAFPATIGVLFILLMLILFTYFGNEICKKWRENAIYLTHGSRNRPPRDTGTVTLSPRQ
ncbi:oxygen-regulated 1, partial [Brachionus plicatilis]